ncbi:hypothetical protein LEP1GSC021_2838 [Leptospira noguchii str. 1993005606]|uniref:hypothetical protein n=1 Tax=Leptospira noguchii TaxID=28182 RepID=UPI0003527DAD|nr:hypothetical protein [Leptospira noguchii]EPE85078.1 hypothetical protein LEP1GSC021_2838 [Leptospira noguchii str. 1993005606]
MSISQVNNYESKVQTVLRPALSQSAVTDMRKKLSELSVLYAEAMLEIQILKKRKKS